MRTARQGVVIFSVSVLLAAWVSAQVKEPTPADPARFAKDIEKFEAADKEHPPKAGGLVFTGSSSIRYWDLKKWFPEYPDAVNRGFGGSQTSDVNFYFDRIIVPQQPKVLVFYCGGNDINAGKSAEVVFDDFKAFMARMHEKLPGTVVIYMSNNPSPKRWDQRETQRKVNAWVQQMADGKKLVYVNAFDALLSPSGEPRPELHRDDKLHLSEAGYEIVTKLVKAEVAKAMAR